VPISVCHDFLLLLDLNLVLDPLANIQRRLNDPAQGVRWCITGDGGYDLQILRTNCEVRADRFVIEDSSIKLRPAEFNAQAPLDLIIELRREVRERRGVTADADAQHGSGLGPGDHAGPKVQNQSGGGCCRRRVVGEDFDPDDLSGRAVQDLRGADLRQDGLAGNGGDNARHSGAVTGAA
jgi:hypothetical protein